jgi:hypothetical protein
MPINRPRVIGEQVTRNGNLGHLERDVTATAAYLHHL